AIQKETHQGLTHESAWARGQAWGLYGYTMAYKETNNPVFLKHAIDIAKYIMEHSNVDEDKIPYWDYDIHNGGERAPKDASAASVIAAGLIDLAQFTENNAYFEYAEDILQSLSSPEYLAGEDTNGYFILKHSVGAFLYNSEIDTPLNYADYYYLEALVRYAKAKNIDLKTLNYNPLKLKFLYLFILLFPLSVIGQKKSSISKDDFAILNLDHPGLEKVKQLVS